MSKLNEEKDYTPFPADKREKLVNIFYAKRASFLFLYVFGTAIFLIGTIFMVATAAGLIIRNLVSWSLGLAAMFLGVFIVVWAEAKRYHNLYIITTWNVRVRTGFIYRHTRKLFFDQISDVRTSREEEEEAADVGDVLVYKEGVEEPFVEFDGVHNPEGVAEIIRRFVQTVDDPPTWDHIER
ncbi:hypothetical protein EU524_00480 [Candidatus Thorarchaeota archaeon]|nr:MAG: hypothetical protein EU524_00480 [Candidatus Thorarchaeota archaeon]